MKDADIVRALAVVMGWIDDPEFKGLFWRCTDGSHVHTDNWSPLTDERDSMAVVDKMVADGRVTLEIAYWFGNPEDERWVVEINNYPNSYKVRGPDRKRAIAEAALRARWLWIEEDGE